jgi:uncharacterized Fe-S cluster protein YjdI
MKEYSNGEIIIYWEPKKCIHSQNCVHGLPQVFDHKARPWINLEKATTDDIIRVVESCPSGALTYKRAGEAQEPPACIAVRAKGPLLVTGNCRLIDAKGKEIASSDPFALCRCGGSKRKPFCDGTHTKIGFNDD